MYRPHTNKLKLVCSVTNLYCRETNKACFVLHGVLKIIGMFLICDSLNIV